MALLNADGIRFGNGSQLSSKYGIIPQNTKQVFYQASAPTGWTQVTTDESGLVNIDNTALRVVSGLTGGATLGLNPFTASFPATPIVVASDADVAIGGTVGETTLTEEQIPSHAHGAGASYNQFTASAGASPFRTPSRIPIAYAFRSSYRQLVNFRTLINAQQPRVVQQPNTTRVIVDRRIPLNNQQPRNFRRPYSFRNRIPFQQPNTFRQPRNWQRPVSFRRPYSARSPFGFQQPRVWNRRVQRRRNDRVNRNRWICRRGWCFPQPFRVNRRANQGRQPRSYWFGVWVNSQQPRNWQRPVTFRRPYAFRVNVPFRVNARSRQPRNNQQPNSYRRPYAFRQPRAYRVVQNFRTPVNQRVPITNRQPDSYRQVVRYPVVNNVRYSQRTLTPGGTIRGDDALGPDSGLRGGGLSHSHPFVASPVPLSGSIDLSLQYIDVIICNFD